MQIRTMAQRLAEEQLACALPRRWSHVQAVAAKASRLAAMFGHADGDSLVAAAWLHDIGYSPALVDTGFHPLDGARWLRRIGFDQRVTGLVAHHTCALVEASERNLDIALLAEFPREQSPVTDALLFCDITTGPNGQDFEVTERLAEIRQRYGPEDVVTRFVDGAQADIISAVQRTVERLRGTGQPM